MSVQSVSSGGGNWGMAAPQAQRMKPPPPDLSLDDMKKMSEKMKAKGKDTSNLDKIIANFADLDTDQSGKVSMSEVDAGAEKFGIEKPKGPPPPPPGGWGPPPGLLSNGQDGDQSAQADDATSISGRLDQLNSLLEKLLKDYGKSGATAQQATDGSAVK